MKKIQVLVVNLALPVTSLLVGFALCEGFLRLGVVDNPLYKRLTTAGEREQPQRKIVILGDSFIYKGGALHNRLIQGLEPYHAEILNLAMPGMGPYDYLSAMQAHGINFRSDVTILGYFAGNDLSDVKYHRVNDASLKGKIKNVFRPFMRQFYLYHLFVEFKSKMHVRWMDFDEMQETGIDEELVRLAQAHQVNSWLLSLPQGRRENFVLENLLMEIDGDQAAAAKIKELIAEVHALCRSINSKLIVVVFPEVAQVKDSHFEFFRKAGIRSS